MEYIMYKQVGLTLIEVMIILCIIGILAAIIIPAINDTSPSPKKQSSALQYQYKVDCIEQYKIIRISDTIFQLLDDHGNGIKCSLSENRNTVATY